MFTLTALWMPLHYKVDFEPIYVGTVVLDLALLDIIARALC